MPGLGELGPVSFTATVTINNQTFTLNISVEIESLPSAEFKYLPESIYTEIPIVLTSVNTGFDSYVWNIENTEIDGEEISYTFSNSGTYSVTLIVTKGECTAQVTQEIDVLLSKALYVPNVFNPNASNPESRVVKVYGNNILEDEFSFTIFNRWGTEVYKTLSFKEANSNGWDGVSISNNENQELNAFTYILKVKFTDGTKTNKTGTITLVR